MTEQTTVAGYMSEVCRQVNDYRSAIQTIAARSFYEGKSIKETVAYIHHYKETEQ